MGKSLNMCYNEVNSSFTKEKIMSAIELNNTFGGLKKLKDDLKKKAQIFSYTSIAFFTVYYIYLLIKNLSNTFYLVAYSLLFLGVIASFIIEILLRENKDADRKTIRKTRENKELFKAIIKTVKYIIKIVLLAIAFYENEVEFNSSITLIVNVLLFIMLLLQIITDYLVRYVSYYLDYLSKCIEQDVKQSALIKAFTFFSAKNVAEKIEDVSYKMAGESKYTKKEEKMYKDIEEGKKKYQEDKKTETSNTIKRSIKKIADTSKEKVKDIASRIINKDNQK